MIKELLGVLGYTELLAGDLMVHQLSIQNNENNIIIIMFTKQSTIIFSQF